METRDREQPGGSGASPSRRRPPLGSCPLLGALTLLLALSAALASPCSAVERPFNLQGTTALLGNPFDPAGAAMVDGHGIATELGAWTNTGTVFFDGSSGPPFGASGFAQFTAANGDHLDAILVGTVDASFVVTATYSLVGGTGRFAGVSGQGGFLAHPNLDGSFSYTANGTIDF